MKKANDNSLFLLFQNADQYFAVPIANVVEVIKSQVLSPIPIERKGLKGLLNLRGDVIPVLSLPQLESESHSLTHYIVIALVNEQRFGFQVEKVHQVVTLDANAFQIVNATEEFSHLYCQLDQKTISIINSFNFIDGVA